MGYPENADLLLRFCSIVHHAADTPSLIRSVAENAQFVRICQALAAPLDDALENQFRAICHQHGFDAARIHRQALGVARALRLESVDEKTPDYYKVLGVSSEADSQAIKHAFRKKAKALHPDRNNAEGDAFLQLHRAYRQLSDNRQRRLYDKACRKRGKWIEAGRSGKHRPVHYTVTLMAVILVALVATTFVLDQVYHHTAFFDRIAPEKSATPAYQNGDIDSQLAGTGGQLPAEVERAQAPASLEDGAGSPLPAMDTVIEPTVEAFLPDFAVATENSSAVLIGKSTDDPEVLSPEAKASSPTAEQRRASQKKTSSDHEEN